MPHDISFTIKVEQGHRRYLAWVDGARDETEVSHPTRAGVVSKLADERLDDSEPAGPLNRGDEGE